MIGADDVARYRERGYLVVEGLLDGATLAELRRVTDEVTAGARGLTGHSEFLDLEASHTPDRPRVRRIKKPWGAHPFYREMAAHRPITDILAKLIGEDIRMRPGGKVNMKAAGYGAPVEWHQDWAFYPHTNDDVLAVGILIDDMTADNGPLTMIPGSHRGPVYDHHADGAFCGAINPGNADIDFASAVAVTAPAGSITVHHARLSHGSAINRSAAPRRLLLFEYAAADAWPLAGTEPVDDFAAFCRRVVRGKPRLRPRLAHVPVRMPFPKAVHQGSIYENQRTLETNYFEHDPAAVAAE